MLFYNLMDMIASNAVKVNTSLMYRDTNITVVLGLMLLEQVLMLMVTVYTCILSLLNPKNINHLEPVISVELITLFSV